MALPNSETYADLLQACTFCCSVLRDTPSRLSGGEAQHVALARAWLRAPLALLLGEPMANMDQESRLCIHSLLRQLKDPGMAILITSHDALQFQLLADRQLLLKDGRISIELTHSQAENVSAFPLNKTSLHHMA